MATVSFAAALLGLHLPGRSSVELKRGSSVTGELSSLPLELACDRRCGPASWGSSERLGDTGGRPFDAPQFCDAEEEGDEVRVNAPGVLWDSVALDCSAGASSRM